MKKIKFLKILFILISISLINCTNEFDYGSVQNAVKTLESSEITPTSAKISGTVLIDNGSAVISKGICYSTDGVPTISGLKKIASTSGLGNFNCLLDNLQASTTYYARAYATNSLGTAYGFAIKFTTLPATIPLLSSTTNPSAITQTTANSGGLITNNGGSTIISRGVCYSSTESVPTVSGTKTINGSGVGSFISTISNLIPNTTYYVRAYATNTVGTGYADVKTFTTSQATIPNGIITAPINSITQTSANSGGTISDDGGYPVTNRGICWSTNNSSPTISNNFVTSGSGIGSYTSTLLPLIAGTTYYVRAFATNSVGTAYGNVISFTTIPASIPSSITTNSLVSITQNTANGGGSVLNDGGAPITSKGVCWSNTNSLPTISNTKTIDGNGTGGFSSQLTTLSPATTYYVRAYATNSAGTGYGTTKTFTTLSPNPPSGITTASISSITQNSASSGGTIGNDGGATITAKGVCWSSTNTQPTIVNSTTNNGTGINSFSSSLTGLNPGTTYYVRAYATNSAGTSYGNTVIFNTQVSLSIGQSYQGGIIGYIFLPGDTGYVSGQTHGLIVNNVNQSTGAQWGCSGSSITGTSQLLGFGVNNTTTIVSLCVTSTIAAALCNNLISNGYNDWFLPSRDELNKLYLNKGSIGGFANTSYWSSSQSTTSGSINAISINFGSGTISNTAKTSLLYVRAVRRF